MQILPLDRGGTGFEDSDIVERMHVLERRSDSPLKGFVPLLRTGVSREMPLRKFGQVAR
jgi:hypothetical protein